jgi:hypothetical protein
MVVGAGSVLVCLVVVAAVVLVVVVVGFTVELFLVSSLYGDPDSFSLDIAQEISNFHSWVQNR